MNRKSVLEKRALIPSTQFLDPLSEDSPKGIWRLQFSADKSTVSIRSLLWPGYFFSHKINQSKYSGAYFGDGKKNGSLPFMI
jgi:radial spoke head protein 9